MSELYKTLEHSFKAAEFDRAVKKVADHLLAKAEAKAKAPGRNKQRAADELQYNKLTLSSAINFSELVYRELFGPRPQPVAIGQERQGRMADTLSVEDRSRIHFDKGAWWFWSSDHATRVGPYDTENLAAEGFVNYKSHLESFDKSCPVAQTAEPPAEILQEPEE